MAIQLPALHQRIILDPTGVKGGAAAYANSMKGVQKASTATGNATQKMGASMASAGYRAQSAGRVLMKNFGLPIAAIGGMALKSFAQFEESMLRIEALVGVSAGSVGRFTDAVKEASAATGRGPQELAEAMFFVASAGLRGATAMEVLHASAKGAAVGLGQTKVVADAATSAVNAYGAENLSGSAAVDVLTAAVREGKVEANRLAPAIGKAIPVASAMGIEFHEVAAAIAAMTRTGTDARTSAIQLRQIMQSLLDPSRQTTKALTEMGIAEGELRRQADEEGLLSVLKRLRDLAEENEDAFADVFPNIRALAGALDITGANLTENEGIFRALANSVGDTDEALQKTSKGAMFKFNRATAGMKISFLELGEAMLPLLTVFVRMAQGVAKFTEAISRTPLLGVAAAMSLIVTVAGALMIAMGKLITVYVGFNVALVQQHVLWWINQIAMGEFFLALKLHLTVATGGLYALVAVIGLVVAAFMIWGKESDTTVKDLANLRDGINDVRQVGERSLQPIHDYADALSHLGQSVPDPEHIKAFNATWREAIDAAGDLSSLGGQVQAEQSLLTHFAGMLKGEDDQEVIDEVVGQFTGLVAELGRQFSGPNNPLGDTFTRLFDSNDSKFVTQQILGFLTDSAGQQEAEMLARVWADGISLELTKGMDEVLGVKSHTQGRDHLINSVTGPVEDALGEIPHIFQKYLLHGDVANAMTIYTGMTDAISDSLEGNVEGAEVQLQIFEKAFMDRMHSVDGFVGDTRKGFDTLHETLEAINSGAIKLPEAGFAGDQAFLDFAEAYVEAWQAINAEIAEANRVGGADWDEMSQWTEIDKQNNALRRATRELRMAEEGWNDLGYEAQQAGDTVGDALIAMEQGFAAADDAAKSFTQRFDDLIGRQTNLVTVQSDYRLGLVDLAEALDESGGSLDDNSVAAIEAQQNFVNLIGMFKDMGSAMLEGGASAEQAQAAVQTLMGSLVGTAELGGASGEAITELLMRSGATPDSIALMFAEEDMSASEALMEEALKVKNQVGPFAFDQGVDIGASTIGGYINGLHMYAPEMINSTLGVFQAMLVALRGPRGIDAKSPSVLFQNKVGVPIGEGIHQGIVTSLHKTKGDYVNVLKDYVNTAISVTNTQINAASGAIKAVLSLEDAQQRLLKAQRETMNMETGGSRSRREDLTEKQLQRRVDEAKRALRLGQGFQEDLEMSLLDAKEAMADFLATADSGSPVAQAQLAVTDASFKGAQALAQMKMGGPEAIAAFKNMAQSSGLGDVADELLGIADSDNVKSVFEQMFSPEVIQSIEDVGAGLGIVKKELLSDDEGAGGFWDKIINFMNINAEGDHGAVGELTTAQATQAAALTSGMFGLGMTGQGPSTTPSMTDFYGVDGFQGMWAAGVGGGTNYDVGGVNIVVATSSDIENVQKIAQQINAATATGILADTGTDASQFQSRGKNWRGLTEQTPTSGPPPVYRNTGGGN